MRNCRLLLNKGICPPQVHSSQSKMVQNDSAKLQYNPLVKRVGTSSPPGQEQRQSNSFHKLSRDANTDCIDGAFLRQDLREELAKGQLHHH
jgi:hypothetical protein